MNELINKGSVPVFISIYLDRQTYPHGLHPYGQHCMPAGTNTLMVGASGGDFFPFSSANAWITVSLQAGRQYEVRAHSGSGVFQFTIVDVTVDPERVVYEFTVPKGSYTSQGRISQPQDLTGSMR